MYIRCSYQILIKSQTSRPILEKNPQRSKFIKIRPVGAELFHEGGEKEGRMEMTKLTGAFHNFAKSA
jgi:hypothetical protein